MYSPVPIENAPATSAAAPDSTTLPGYYRARAQANALLATHTGHRCCPALPWANLLRAKNPVPVTPSPRQWRQTAATAAVPDEKENRWRH